MFHAFANSNANTLIGAPANRDDSEAWNPAQRIGTKIDILREASCSGDVTFDLGRVTARVVSVTAEPQGEYPR